MNIEQLAQAWEQAKEEREKLETEYNATVGRVAVGTGKKLETSVMRRQLLPELIAAAQITEYGAQAELYQAEAESLKPQLVELRTEAEAIEADIARLQAKLHPIRRKIAGLDDNIKHRQSEQRRLRRLVADALAGEQQRSRLERAPVVHALNV